MDEGRNMAEIKLKKREEMDPAYCWDLSSLFGSDEEFEKTEQELAKKIEAFRAKQGTMKESAEALYDVLSGLDDISRVFSSLYVYASQKVTRIWEIRSTGLCRKDGQHDGCSCGCLFFRRAGDPGA